MPIYQQLAEHSARIESLQEKQGSDRCHFWQAGGGYDRNLSKLDTIIQTIRYIHQYPVRKGFVQAPSDWHWSSCKEWEGRGTGPLPIQLDLYPGN